jgi:hypothetical protein
MKMADGGFRPAFNVQVVSVAGEQIVIDVAPLATGSDRGLLRQRLQAVRERLGRLPRRHLADGGFTAADDIEWAHDEQVKVYCPPTQSKHGTNPYAPRRDDGPGVLPLRGVWRGGHPAGAASPHRFTHRLARISGAVEGPDF